jgi:DNA-binding response OmpR family regulator
MINYHSKTTFGSSNTEKKMEKVLLVFDDQIIAEFIEKNLEENGFQIYKTDNLKDAVISAEKVIPELIVVNTLDEPIDLHNFSKQVKTQRLNTVPILALVELENYLKTTNKEDLIVKPMKPKLLLSLIRSIMNNEETSWLPALH